MLDIGESGSFFLLHIKTPAGIRRAIAPVQFPDLASAHHNVREDIPELAAELLRSGVNPMLCAYLICNTEGALLLEVPFTDLVEPDAAPAWPAALQAIGPAS